ncbi:DNA-binding response regulator [Micromonospora taraxaci]|uniref:DNA-binding response regulator n=1 Tax=Micromonospora taraxaci TaxID=1316803 RepID=UPI0033B7836C
MTKGHTRVGVRVAIVDPLPVFRHGAVAALTAAGHVVQTPTDVVGWATASSEGIVVLTVLAENDWIGLTTLRAAQPQVKLVILLEDTAVAASVRAVKSGAVSVLPRRATPEALCRCIDAVVDGIAMLPTDVVTTLAAEAREHGTVVPVSLAKIGWLRALASGTTVSQLAVHAGYSERAMYRLLRDLYQDLGVGNRVEALILAHGRGWLR